MRAAVYRTAHIVHTGMIEASLWLLAAPFMLTGLLAGLLVSFALWVVASILVGYHAGRLKD